MSAETVMTAVSADPAAPLAVQITCTVVEYSVSACAAVKVGPAFVVLLNV